MSVQLATIIQNGEPFLIGEWLLEPMLNRLTRGDTMVQLELKAMDVLLCLAEHAGEVMGKHDLLDEVWQTEFVSDNTLQRRIAELREAFGDNASRPCYIETIRKRGYRLIAEVVAVTTAGEIAMAIPETPVPPDEERNPYPGLAAFTEIDANLTLRPDHRGRGSVAQNHLSAPAGRDRSFGHRQELTAARRSRLPEPRPAGGWWSSPRAKCRCCRWHGL